MDGMFCEGLPANSCLQYQPSITINPHQSGAILLVSAVQDNQVHEGGVGFEIDTDEGSDNVVAVSVMADIAGAFALTSFVKTTYSDANSQISSLPSIYNPDGWPNYITSLVQRTDAAGNAITGIIINPNPLVKPK